MENWKIRKRQGACSVTGRPFDEGERHVSTLSVRDGEFVREDVSLEAWRERVADAGVEDLFFWFTRHYADKKRTLQLDLESLEQLFHKLAERPEEPLRELRFVLCLLLMRKRRLKLETVERTADGERMVVRRPRLKEGEERWRVEVFDFDPERAEEIRQRLHEVFEGADPDQELDGGAGAAAEAPAEGEGAEEAPGAATRGPEADAELDGEDATSAAADAEPEPRGAAASGRR